MTQIDRERLSAFEMWVWKRIIWVDRVMSDEVFANGNI